MDLLKGFYRKCAAIMNYNDCKEDNYKWNKLAKQCLDKDFNIINDLNTPFKCLKNNKTWDNYRGRCILRNIKNEYDCLHNELPSIWNDGFCVAIKTEKQCAGTAGNGE